MRLRLNEQDAERLGCEQVLTFETALVSVADVGELADRYDFDPYDWPHPLFGEIAFADAGNPDAKPKPPRWQQHAVVWLTLRQNGHAVSWDAAGTVSAMRLAFLADEEAPGKDEEPSTESEASTTPPSENSSG